MSVSMSGSQHLRVPDEAAPHSQLRAVHAVLQAGGRGERIRAVADGLAKPLIRVGDTPMLGRLLRQAFAAGVDGATVVIPGGNPSLKQYVEQLDDARVRTIEERAPLGNA